MSSHATTCSVCGVAAAREVMRPRTVDLRSGIFTVENDVVTHCANCAESYYTPEQAVRSARLLDEVRAASWNTLPAYRIRQIREAAGLTQVQLEERLGLGQKVVTRWERGECPPNSAADSLLRLLGLMPWLLDAARPILPAKRAPLAVSSVYVVSGAVSSPAYWVQVPIVIENVRRPALVSEVPSSMTKAVQLICATQEAYR